ncbi:MAG TPA: hypothetical protein VJX66_05615 [Amycolatopsis sp.]|nr:hypothetical protein [Amycolatopsis sp.]
MLNVAEDARHGGDELRVAERQRGWYRSDVDRRLARVGAAQDLVGLGERAFGR